MGEAGAAALQIRLLDGLPLTVSRPCLVAAGDLVAADADDPLDHRQVAPDRVLEDDDVAAAYLGAVDPLGQHPVARPRWSAAWSRSARYRAGRSAPPRRSRPGTAHSRRPRPARTARCPSAGRGRRSCVPYCCSSQRSHPADSGPRRRSGTAPYLAVTLPPVSLRRRHSTSGTAPARPRAAGRRRQALLMPGWSKVSGTGRVAQRLMRPGDDDRAADDLVRPRPCRCP